MVVMLSGLITGDSWAQRLSQFYEAPKKSDRPDQKAAAFPYITYRLHANGYLWNVVNNNSIIGNIFGFEMPDESKQAPSYYHPGYNRKQHGRYSALWVGGVVRGDTLVTVGMDVAWDFWDVYDRGYPMEFWPDEWPFGNMTVRSNDPGSPYFDTDARAELEVEAVYTDTAEDYWWIPYNPYDGRDHKSMGLKVTQTSYSWSYKYARDFILIDYLIENKGRDTIYDGFVGFYHVGGVFHRGEQPWPPYDDVEGYIRSLPHEFEEVGMEDLWLAYVLDNDGHSFSIAWDFINTASASAFAPLRVPKGASLYNFNWWTDQEGARFAWGPRKRATHEWPLRRFAGALGIPYSDEHKYYLMSKPEVDYNGYETAVDHSDEGWLPPHEYAGVTARGHFPKVLTSYGPVTLPPGAATNLTMVIAIGENVHYDRVAYRETFDTLNPYPFMEQLDFDDLITNVRWAKQVFDNPGIDTDFDGDSGKYFDRFDTMTGDSVRIYYKGDGVPDFRGATPPPPPDVRVTPQDGRIIVRWNGRNTENYFDPLSYARDFEGYRVYISRSANFDQSAMLTSYDKHNYSRYKWDQRRLRYMLTELPFTLDSLLVLYGDDLDPYAYSYADPLEVGDEWFYFEPVDYNVSDLSTMSGIHKLYPDAINDTADVDEEGRMRFYEYEYFIENLLPTVPYWVSVTAFDHGHPPKGLDALESHPRQNMVEAVAIKQGADVLRDGKLDVYCYPNPYRVDANYPERGYENRGNELPAARAGTIYFANLPHQCSISIYTLDGDLVRRLEHDEAEGSGTASVHRWNIISRNTQWVVSGLYYWVVETTFDSQVGKLVIIK
ncbi:MAG: hypothetical protein OEV49_01670 [candidate division Zixibacteria bacterium]|nr:hypothetical protein [candidate division Zixibacteria bacterium]MDH4032593.1 hypothetical protein [candidate division Zixibacteria bacterium]